MQIRLISAKKRFYGYIAGIQKEASQYLRRNTDFVPTKWRLSSWRSGHYLFIFHRRCELQAEGHEPV